MNPLCRVGGTRSGPALALALLVLPGGLAAQPRPTAPEPCRDCPPPSSPSTPPPSAAPTPHSVVPARTSDLWRDPIFLEVEAGATYTNLMAVRGGRSVFPNMVSYSGWGPGVGVTAGFHALLFSVGVQVYFSSLGGEGTVLNPTTASGNTAPGGFHMIATTLEGALRLPLGRVEPTLRIGVGHMFLGGFAVSTSTGWQSPSANGWTARMGLGFDVRIWRRFFVGADIDVAVANLRRNGIPSTDCSSGDPFCVELQQNGDAIALMVHPHAQFGVHF